MTKPGDISSVTTGDLITAAIFNEHVTALNWLLSFAVPTGTMMDYLGSSSPDTDDWLLCDGSTIGSASSGSDYTGTTYQELFEHIWDSTSNTYFPIQDSGGTPTTRGASASADFSADKRMPLPDLRGRSTIGLDNLGGSSANRVTAAAADNIGGSGGAETHTLTTSEMPTHGHIRYRGGATATPGAYVQAGQTGSYATAGGNQFLPAEDAGSGSAHNNMQPYMAVGKIIKV